MLTMSKRLPSFIAIVFAFVSLGFSPAYAVDERVIDVVAVTWNGATTALSNPATVAERLYMRVACVITQLHRRFL